MSARDPSPQEPTPAAVDPALFRQVFPRPRVCRSARAAAAVVAGCLVLLLTACGQALPRRLAVLPTAPLPSGGGAPAPAQGSSAPPMGWNSWNAFGFAVNAATVEAQARALVTSGMAAAGYDYVVLDGGWAAPTRDTQGNLRPDPVKFPQGIAAVASYVHSLGLKFGIHQAAGMTDCQGRTPGTQSAPGGAMQDASLFASWGVDFIKYDLCRYRFPAGTTPGAPDLVGISVLRGDQAVGSYWAASAINTLSGGARVAACAACPTGEDVTAIGIEDGALRFNDVIAPVSGEYTLVIRYVHVDSSSSPMYWNYRWHRMTLLSVDGGSPQAIYYPVPLNASGQITGWGTLGTETTEVHLQEGPNSLIFSDPHSFEDVVRSVYQQMAEAIAATGRPMVLSVSEYGVSRPWLWAPGMAQMWRTTDDVAAVWSGPIRRGYRGRGRVSIMAALDQQVGLAPYTRPGGANDPDMLQVGNGDLSLAEDQAMFSLWAILRAPLFAGNDLVDMSPQVRDILTNTEVIAVDQDPLAAEGIRIVDTADEQIWVRPLASGARAVVLFNTSDHPETITVAVPALGLPSAAWYAVRDLWAHATWTTTRDISASVPAHGVAMYRVWASGPKGRIGSLETVLGAP